MKKFNDYYLGLDLGTSSIGWAVTDEKYDILRFNKKFMWGTHLFDTGNTAAERRIFRTSRRRLKRKKNRIELLQALFSEEISKKDFGFFQRLKESQYDIEDKTVKNKILSMFYNQHIELNNIPNVIGINMLEQILIKTPLIYWQGMMYKFFKEGKTYPELIRIMSNIIEFKDNIYINNIQQGEIFLKVFKQYYKELVEKAN